MKCTHTIRSSVETDEGEELKGQRCRILTKAERTDMEGPGRGWTYVFLPAKSDVYAVQVTSLRPL